MSLKTIELETAPQPDAAIIWLHGLGADGNDFVPVVPELTRGTTRAWRFVFPHAEVRPVTLNGGMRMRAWYDIRGLDRAAVEDEAGFRAAEAAVGELIAKQVSLGIPSRRIVIAGFSQGGAVALYMAPRYPGALAGVMALSSYLPLAARLTADRLGHNDATPIFMAHGLADPVLPVSMGRDSRDALVRAGYSVEWHQYPMAHSVCAEELSDIRSYLLRVLP